MLPAFTPYILSCDDMFIIDATNEAGDTEYHAPTIRSLTSACTDAQILRVG